jgi:hypothetical protein
MKLRTFDRLILLNILPTNGDIVTLRVVQELQTALSFTEAEHAALQFETLDSGQVRWKTEADIEREIPVGSAALGVLRQRLIELNHEHKLRMEHIPLYERIVEKQEG